MMAVAGIVDQQVDGAEVVQRAGCGGGDLRAVAAR